jgi:hypothetical protein
MNENNLTQTAAEQEDKAVDALIKILMTVIVILAAFSAGYYTAASESATMVKILVSQQ